MIKYTLEDMVNWGIDLDQFDRCDWQFDPYINAIYVRPESKIAIWLALFESRKTNGRLPI